MDNQTRPSWEFIEGEKWKLKWMQWEIKEDKKKWKADKEFIERNPHLAT